MAPSSPPSSDKPKDGRADNGKHLVAHQFKPGQSGNPGGQNRKALEKIAFAHAAREYTDEALETLVKLMRQKRSLDIKLRAAVEIINRGYGKPTESVEINDKKFVAFVPLPMEREAWLAAVQNRKGVNGHGITIDQPSSPSSSSSPPGSPSPSSKLNS